MDSIEMYMIKLGIIEKVGDNVRVIICFCVYMSCLIEFFVKY